LLILHPGVPKTGTTFLQQQLKSEPWYFGPSKECETSALLSKLARAFSAADLDAVLEEAATAESRHGTVLISEEAFLSIRPYEMAMRIGLYRALEPAHLLSSCWTAPETKLLALVKAVAGRPHAWLFTVREHRKWCTSFYRYSLSELDPGRAGLFLANAAHAGAVGGPVFKTSIDLVRALDPSAEIIVVPMEIFTSPPRMAEFEQLMRKRLGLKIALPRDAKVENASLIALPAPYKRFVSQASVALKNKRLKRIGARAERAVGAVLSNLYLYDRSGADSALASALESAAGLFAEDTKELQRLCAFDLHEIGYGQPASAATPHRVSGISTT
jgi:hypothetical protein